MKEDALCVVKLPPILDGVVFSSVTVLHRDCCSICRAPTWLDKAQMAWSKVPCLSPGTGASICSTFKCDPSSRLMLQ